MNADPTLPPTLISFSYNTEVISGIDVKPCQLSGQCCHNTLLPPHNRHSKSVSSWLIFANNTSCGGCVCVWMGMNVWAGGGWLCILWKNRVQQNSVWVCFKKMGCPGLWLQTFWLYAQHKHLTKEVVLSHEPVRRRQQRWSTGGMQNMEVIYRLEKVSDGLCLLRLSSSGRCSWIACHKKKA